MVHKSDNVIEKRLANGLTVLVKPMRHAPVATFWMWYRVGSRNEQPGITGASHWVEHMQFKGTEKFSGDLLDRLIAREGGAWNAMTFYDWTAYYEVLPATKIDLALQIEADRMTGTLFSTDDVESERTVILSERNGSENSPSWRLYEEMGGLAFRVHPYRNTVIGEKIDIETMTRDDLYTHYRRFYTPGNAVAVLVGDIDPDHSLARIEELFGPIPDGEVVSSVARPEPAQYGERRVRMVREGTTGYVSIAFKSLETSHPDFLAFSILDSILAGASSLNFMSTAYTSSRTSRLHKAMIETQLAASLSGGLIATLEPYLYSMTAVVNDGKTHEEVEEALLAEFDRAASGDITSAEFERAKKQARALFAYDSESVSSQGFWLGFSQILTGNYAWADDYLDQLDAVTLDDVNRVAHNLFDPLRRIVGWYIPTGLDEEEPA